MILTKQDKEILRSFGYPDSDFEQIKQATFKKYTTYEINNREATLEEVLEVLDRKEYLGGISRSAFHFSSTVSSKNGDIVYFNSSKLFK